MPAEGEQDSSEDEDELLAKAIALSLAAEVDTYSDFHASRVFVKYTMLFLG